MAHVFGVHVGSSTACLAVYKEGKTEVIANDAGDRVTPAVAAFHDNEKLVGIAAKQQLVRNSANAVVCNKLFIGKNVSTPQLDDLLKKLTCKVTKRERDIRYDFEFGGKVQSYSPEDIAVLMYKKMKDIASSHVHDQKTLNAVVTVPVSFSTSDRKLIKQSAEKGGFNVLQVISEPAAAVLAYNSMEDDANILVYRLGGTTADASVFNTCRGALYMKANVVKDIGGDIATTKLTEYLADEFYRKYKSDPRDSRRSMRKLYFAAETCKHVLSSMSTAHCFVESLCDGVDFSLNVTRARFDSLIQPHLADFLEPVHQALKMASFENSSIQKVILCGGSSKMPRLQKAFVDMFPAATVLTSINPDEVIARGAAVQGSFLSEAWDAECATPSVEIGTLSNGLALRVTSGGKCDLSLPRGAAVSARTSASLHAEADILTAAVYEIREEEHLLAELVLNEAEGKTVTASMHVRSNGSVHATLSNEETGKVSSITIEVSED